MEVQGIETFRRVVVLTSLLFSCISILIICLRPRECDSNPQLRRGVIIACSVQLFIFLLLLLHYIHCGCLLRKLGMALGVSYFGIVGCMVWTQLIFFRGEGCMRVAVVYYWWLALNIGIFYVFIAYGLSLWGAYLCWAQEEEEAIAQEAMQHKFDKMVASGKVDPEMLCHPQNP